MSLEAKLTAAAIELTGDDSIIDVAEFRPKGTAGATFAGAAAGSLAGGAATDGNTWGQAFGAAGGVAAGQAAAGMAQGLPFSVAVAVSPDKVYVMGLPKGFKSIEPIAVIDREKLGVEVHQRATVRTVVLEDLQTGQKIPPEMPRLNFYHGKALVELLMLSEAHHDEELTEDSLAADPVE